MPRQTFSNWFWAKIAGAEAGMDTEHFDGVTTEKQS